MAGTVQNIKMLAIQQHHINNLQEKLNQQKLEFFNKISSIKGWETFITKHTSTYQRPKDVLKYIADPYLIQACEMEFDDDANTCAFVITYHRSYSYSRSSLLKFRTQHIPCREIDEFINSPEPVEENDSSDPVYWSTAAPSPKLTIDFS